MKEGCLCVHAYVCKGVLYKWSDTWSKLSYTPAHTGTIFKSSIHIVTQFSASIKPAGLKIGFGQVQWSLRSGGSEQKEKFFPAIYKMHYSGRKVHLQQAPSRCAHTPT